MGGGERHGPMGERSLRRARAVQRQAVHLLYRSISKPLRRRPRGGAEEHGLHGASRPDSVLAEWPRTAVRPSSPYQSVGLS
jgi:hypothetical protein